MAEYQWDESKDPESLEVIATEKITSGEQLGFHTALETGEPLYASYTASGDIKENTELQIFAFMDGKPLNALDGSWYCRMNVNPGNLFEIPLDMAQIPSGDHLIYFLSFDTAQSGLITGKGETDSGIHGVGVGAYVCDVKVP